MSFLIVPNAINRQGKTFYTSYNIQYLVIAGGGGGGSQYYAGGGGAGGYRNSYASETSGRDSSTESVYATTSATAITIQVGAGGYGGKYEYAQEAPGGPAQAINTYKQGGDGEDSIFSTITSIGGGGGGNSNSPDEPGRDGGSGGGAAQDYISPYSAAGGSGTAGQGYDGGSTTAYSTGSGGCGGGGATAEGVGGGGPSEAGHGGAGLFSNITTTNTQRAGGGGGASHTTQGPSGFGGAGGGGRGAGGNGASGSPANGNAVPGTVNTGSGGGAGCYHAGSTAWPYGKDGGSGIVVLRMLTANYTGTTSGSPAVSTSGSDTILTYTGDGSYTP